MATSIFVNVPVANLPASRAFYEALGYGFNAQFSDDTAASLVISDTIYFMLLTHKKFAEFTPLPIADAKTATGALFALSFNSRDEVDAMVDKALAAGGTEPRGAQDHGFMYSRAFADLDGHIFEIVWMDPSFVTG